MHWGLNFCMLLYIFFITTGREAASHISPYRGFSWRGTLAKTRNPHSRCIRPQQSHRMIMRGPMIFYNSLLPTRCAHGSLFSMQLSCGTNGVTIFIFMLFHCPSFCNKHTFWWRMPGSSRVRCCSLQWRKKTGNVSLVAWQPNLLHSDTGYSGYRP